MLAGGTNLQQQLTSQQFPDCLDNIHWPGTFASAYTKGFAARAVAQVRSCLEDAQRLQGPYAFWTLCLASKCVHDRQMPWDGQLRYDRQLP